MTRPEPPRNLELRQVQALERIAESLEKLVEMGQPARMVPSGSRSDTEIGGGHLMFAGPDFDPENPSMADLVPPEAIREGQEIMDEIAKRQPPITTPAAARPEGVHITERERRAREAFDRGEDVSGYRPADPDEPEVEPMTDESDDGR